MPTRLICRHIVPAAIGVLAVALFMQPLNAEQEALESFPISIERMKRSIAPVVCRTGVADKPVSLILGTAFFVSSEGEFVTAAHVVEGAPVTCVTAIYVPLDGWRSESEAIRLFNFRRQDCRVETNADIAVCQTMVQPTTVPGVDAEPVVLEPFAFPADGTEIAFTGFPLRNAEPLTARGFLAAYRNPTRNGGERWILDRTAWPGSSGSPVYLQDGRVIGVVIQRGINDASGLAYARPASQIGASVRAFRDNKARNHDAAAPNPAHP